MCARDDKDGRITAGFAELRYQGGAYPGAPVDMGSMSAFAPYDLENVKTVGWDVVTNRPKQAAYRAPGAPMAAFAVESAIDELAKGFGLDPLEVRLKNGADEGTRASYGPTYPAIGLKATLEAAKDAPPLDGAAGRKPGPRRCLRLLVQFRRQHLRERSTSPRRHRDRDRGQPGYRRLARVDDDDGRRGAGHPL